MSSDELIRLLKRAGWKKVHQKGSHIQFTHALQAGKITVPHPYKDMALGTCKAILKQAGLSQ